MILDEIVLHNFGVFRGEQRAKLTPPSRKKPIVLFGGLNGCGKTTLLEALQLALYGKLSPSRQGNRGYEEYLTGAIHRSVSHRDGAAVEIAFRSVEDGSERSYRVRRSWAIRRKRIRETLSVAVNGVFDDALTDTWAEHVERFIPERLSHLFFFDGERIETLADPSRSTALLSFAIHALLGADLVEQLRTDLIALDRRKRKETKSGPDQRRIEENEQELAVAQNRLGRLQQECAALRNERDRAAKLLSENGKKLSQEGGDLVEQQKELEQEHAAVKQNLESLRKELIEMASGALPLLLASNLIRDVSKQAKKEDDSHRQELLREALVKRNKKLLQHLKKARTSASVVKRVQGFLESEEKGLGSAGESYLNLDGETQHRLVWLEERLLEDQQSAKDLLSREEGLRQNLDTLERKLAAVPEKETLGALYKERDKRRKRLEDLDRKLLQREHEAHKATLLVEHLADRLNKTLRAQKQAEVDNRDIERFLIHAERVRGTLEKFRVTMTERHARRLAEMILDGYAQLLRKESLVAHLELDPTTCALSLWNSRRQRLDPQNLSAGERQLLAVSLLWGLGRAAGRPLPVVVDTPLGRLDSAHRSHLVERYFPFASHQVLLLSTDEEIDNEHFRSLKPRIGHSYRLDYDEDTESSRIEQGYFW